MPASAVYLLDLKGKVRSYRGEWRREPSIDTRTRFLASDWACVPCEIVGISGLVLTFQYWSHFC